MNTLFLLMPVVGALVAWITCRLMLWAIVRPVLPVKIAGFEIQGVLPRLQQKPEKISDPVSHMIIDLLESETAQADLSTVRPIIAQHLDTYLTVRLKEKMPVIASFIGPSTTEKLKESMIEEIDSLLPQVMNEFLSGKFNEQTIKAIIEKKISGIPPTVTETIVNWEKKRLSYITYGAIAFGAFTGLVADIVYYLITTR